MREILFKAKRMDNGEWVEGAYLHQTDYYGEKCDKHYIIDGTETDMEGYGEHYLIDKDTLCQYTGLTDKNGNKIWENDVVEVTYRDSRFAENYTEIGFIKYFSCSARYRYVFKEETWNFDCSTEIEVIGNIFDNPEQIGGGE